MRWCLGKGHTTTGQQRNELGPGSLPSKSLVRARMYPAWRAGKPGLRRTWFEVTPGHGMEEDLCGGLCLCRSLALWLLLLEDGGQRS